VALATRRLAAVDRVTGPVPQLNLPELDPFYSGASWYHDYIAYCGVSEQREALCGRHPSGARQAGAEKRMSSHPAETTSPDSECPPPVWERNPLRVTYPPDENHKLKFSLRRRMVDVVKDAEEPEE